MARARSARCPQRIVVLGGGTGTFTVLMGLKGYPVELSAIVSIADSAGSTGILRDELGVLPPGDIRQGLVALAEGDGVLRKLFNYRFSGDGTLGGHSFGNIFMAALEMITGDPLAAIREAHRILKVRGRVIPVSATAANLFAELTDGVVVRGEGAIDKPHPRAPIRRCFLDPVVKATKEALQAIGDAHVVVIAPGDLFTSMIPVLLVEGITKAIMHSRAQRVLVLNLATKDGQTNGYTAQTFCDTVQGALGEALLDTVIVNNARPPRSLISRYKAAGEYPLKDDLSTSRFVVVRRPLLSKAIVHAQGGDRLARSLLRHDSYKLGTALMEVATRWRGRRR